MTHSPDPNVRAELERLLADDNSRLGDVYRLSGRGLHPDAIARELGVSTAGFVSNYRTIANAILDGSTPAKPAIAKQVASSVRARLKAWRLSPEARGYLADVLEQLEQVVGTSRSPTSARQAASASEASEASDRHTSIKSLREQVDKELRDRVSALVGAIKAEADLDPDDYARVASSTSPLDALAAMVLLERPSRTFSDLGRLGRLDLSLEAHVIEWANDLPFRVDLVEAARGRLDYYQGEAADWL
jgi:hypothetical protein